MGIQEKVFSILTEEYRLYAEWTKETAIYPTREIAIMCSLLGLGGETVELKHHIENMSESSLVEKEYGDILWYIGQLAYTTGIHKEIVIGPELEDNFTEVIDYVGLLQELFKKIIRDNNFVIEGEKREKFISIINDILAFIYNDLSYTQFRFDFLDILKKNQEKLESRKARGVIGGSGDSR